MAMDHSWTGTLLHKGKVISRICIKTAWPIPVPLEGRLELNQKMTQSNFINKVMPRTVKGEQPTSLSLDTPDIYEETVIQVGLVEPTDDSSKHIWAKFSSFLSVSSSVGVSNMEGRGGHLFVAAPSQDQGPFESLFTNFHEHKSGSMMCVIFLWDTSYLKMATLPDPWGDVITPEDADDDNNDDMRDDDKIPPELSIKNEPDDGEADAVQEDANTSTEAAAAAETSSASGAQVDDGKTQTAKSGSVLADLALVEEERLASRVNPPNPKLEMRKIDEKLSNTVEGILKFVQSSMQVSASKKATDVSENPKDSSGSVERGLGKLNPVALQYGGGEEDNTGGRLQTSGDVVSAVVIKQEQGTEPSSGDNKNTDAQVSRSATSERQITSTDHSTDTYVSKQSIREVKREPDTTVPAGQSRPTRLISDNGDTASELMDGDDITDNDIISAQLIDDMDDDNAKSWQGVGQHNGDDGAVKDSNEPVVFSERETITSKQSDGIQSIAGTTSTSTVQRMYGYFKQKSVQSSWGSTQKRARRSCTDSAFQVTIPGISSIRKQNMALNESKDDNQSTDRPALEPSGRLLPARTVTTSKADERATNGTDGTFPAMPPAMSPYVICPQTPPFGQERNTMENSNRPPYPVDEPPPYNGGVWGAESAAGYNERTGGRPRTVLDINTIRILTGVCDALRNEECCRRRCAAVVESLVNLLQSSDAQHSKDEYSKRILGMLDTLATPDNTSRLKNEVTTTTCFQSVEDAGRAFMQSRSQALRGDNSLQGQLQSQINVMIQKAKSDIIKDLGLKSPKKKSPRKKEAPPPPVPHQPHVPAGKIFIPFSRKTLQPLKLVPVGNPAPFGRDFGYYSVGARSISYLQHLWYTAYLIAKDGIDKIQSNKVIPIVGGIKRQKQGLQQEFGKEVFRNDLKRRPCRLYKEYDVLHAFYHFHKTVLLANVWFRTDYKQMMMQRLQFIHRKLMIQVKYLRQSRDLLRDALTGPILIDDQRPIFHYAFNACATFEQRLDSKLAECRANMDQRRAENEKVRTFQQKSENVDSSQLEDLDFDCASEQKDHQSLSSGKPSDRDSVSRVSSHSRGRTRSPSAGIRPPSPSLSSSNSDSSSTQPSADDKKYQQPPGDTASASIDKLIKSGRQREERQRRLSLNDSDKRCNSGDDDHRRDRKKRSSISPRRRRTPSPFRPRRSSSSGRRHSRSSLKPRRRARSRDRSRDRSHDRSRDRSRNRSRGPIKAPKFSPAGAHKAFPIRPTPQMIKNYKTKLCINWNKHGSCALGEMCCYAHGEEEIKKFRT